MIRVVFIPGNSNLTTKDNWFPSVKKELEANGLKVIDAEFPDPDLAREEYWIPFLLKVLKVDENTILVGHSSGAIAAMKLAENHKILGSVLVGVYHNDLGIEKEKQAGYFNRPWNWEKIRDNQQWTVLFASQDDPWIPIDHPRFIHLQLNSEYHEFKDQGHFGGDYYKPNFPELSAAILSKFRKENI
jgi:predicted alpha/beta hydrolase family esterase